MINIALNPTWILFLVCVISLCGLIAATIFSSSFRKDLSAKEGEASLFGFSLKGAVIIVLIGVLLFTSYQLQVLLEPQIPPTDPAKRTINEFYSNINEGIKYYGTEKGNKAFSKSWALFTPDYQENRDEKFPELEIRKFPEQFGELYKSSRPIQLLLIQRIGESPFLGTLDYFVIYRLDEKHIENPIHKHFEQETVTKFEELKETFPTLGTFEDEIVNQIDKEFNLEETAKKLKISKEMLIGIIREHINDQFVNRVIGHRFLTEVSSTFAIPSKKDSPPRPGIPTISKYITYNTFQSVKITLRDINGKWKIDKIRLVSLYASPKK